eukprot:132735-Chlamydomonas_euryale.AAC.12
MALRHAVDTMRHIMQKGLRHPGTCSAASQVARQPNQTPQQALQDAPADRPCPQPACQAC